MSDFQATRDPNRLARPDRDINHVIAYGQSLSSGWEGWPALSLTQPHDSLMLGDSVRPVSEYAPDWQPVGAPTFRPLVATVQSTDGDLLDAAAAAGLPQGAIHLGETVLEAAVNGWRGRMLRTLGQHAAGRRILASSCGVGGRSIEALSKGAAPELFHRVRACATLGRDVARANGLGYGVGAFLFLQGENNSLAVDGAVSDRAGYRTRLEQMYYDLVEDIGKSIAIQPLPPAMFTYQTGAIYASDDLGVAQAQLDVALTQPGCFMVGPSYPVTDKGGHLDANGYRWLGAYFGRVMHRVLTLGEEWKPLHPLTVFRDGDSIRATFHVPSPPLVWGTPFVGHQASDVADKGFSVMDGSGEVPLARVVLVGPTEIRLVPARPLVGAATLSYASRRRGGTGCLRDSESDVSDDRYVFDAATGHAPSAAIDSLIGRPYPLANWCVAFARPVDAVAPPPSAWDVLRGATLGDEEEADAVAAPSLSWLSRWRGRHD